jgi:hypothetical protein
VAVIAIRGDHVVGLADRAFAADGDGLLADVEVEEPADLAADVGARGLFFHAANQLHLAVLSEELFGQARPPSKGPAP